MSALDPSHEPVPSAEEVAAELSAGPPQPAEAAGDQVPPAPPAPPEPARPRRYPSTIGGSFYLLILAATAAGIVVVWLGDWRVGIRIIAGALGAATLLRLVLPAKEAGMLAVRHRVVDCLLLGGACALLFFLAGTIPDRPV